MFRQLFILTVGKVIAWPIRRRLRAFDLAVESPEAVQQELLRSILRHQADTQFGRDHYFADIRSLAEFRRNVPVAPYEYVEPYIERVKRGDTRALLSDPAVLMFALTSGTTAARKFIPVTHRYLADYRRGWNLWGLRALRDHRPISLRPIVQLVGDPEEFRTEAGIPCGSISGFTASVQKRIIRRLYCVPAIAGRIKDATARNYVALLFSLPRSVGMLLAANPSSLVSLARTADKLKESLIRDIADGALASTLDVPAPIRAALERRLKRRPATARRLEAIAGRTGTLAPKDVWANNPILIGTWTGGSVGPYLRQLPAFYGNPFLRDLGLIASEGRMTIPVEDTTSAGVLDITTHFFEFIPESEADSKNPTALGAHELIEGRHYFVLPTTAYGLYRYDIRDLVKVVGFRGRTPLLQFLGKGNHFANLTGEKLSEYQVTRAMEDVAGKCGFAPSNYSLAPCWNDAQPYYALFVERGDGLDGERGSQFLREFDRCLMQHNTEYESKRQSQRLGSVRLAVMPPGFWHQWDRERLKTSGGVPEQYKHPCLLGDILFRDSVPVEQEVSPAE
jgi:hypothetical protein